MEDNFLCQYVNQNTRQNNILDLFLTSDANFVKLVECSEIFISDHLMVKVFTDFFQCLSPGSKVKQRANTSTDFNIFNINKANFE